MPRSGNWESSTVPNGLVPDCFIRFLFKFMMAARNAGTVLFQNNHAEIEFMIFIVLPSWLTTPANITYNT